MNSVKVIKDSIIYTKDHNVIYNIDSNVSLVVYEYSINDSSNIIINLNKEGSSVEYHYSTINTKDNTFKITVNHNLSNTTSNIYNHGINVLDKSLIFDVYGIVPKNSDKCIANQENQIINLSNGSGEINPNLLIDNYDVTSSHSAYIGEFNKDKVFYLMSRGIKEKDAINMLIENLVVNNANKSEKIVKEFLSGLRSVLWTEKQEEK